MESREDKSFCVRKTNRLKKPEASKRIKKTPSRKRKIRNGLERISGREGPNKNIGKEDAN